MTSGVDEVRRAFRGTELDGLPVREDESGALMVEDIDPGRVLESWRAARQVLAPTGRRPVAITPEWLPELPEVPPHRLAELDAEATGRADADVFARWVNETPTPQAGWHAYLEAYFPGAGLPAQMAAGLPDPVLDADVDRWVHDRVTAGASVLSTDGLRQRVRQRQEWFRPDVVELALVPTTSPWLVGAWLHHYGAEQDPVGLLAALHRWSTRWGAELVASWGTMLQLSVERRPSDPEEAWELAGQLLAWGGSLQMSRWELALVLPQADTWFLHDRP